jgi:hypothetical protein
MTRHNPSYIHPSLPQKDRRAREAFSKWTPLEVGRNLRWNSDKIMRRAGHKKKSILRASGAEQVDFFSRPQRIYHFSMFNGHLSFSRSKPSF